jgi:hypothetical protein
MSRHRRNANAVVTPDYTPMTLNELLDEEDREDSRAKLTGPSRGSRSNSTHSFDEGEDEDADELLSGGERWEDDRTWPGEPRTMTPDEVLDEAGLSDLDDIYPPLTDEDFEDDDTPIGRDNKRRLGRVSRGPNQLAGRVTNAVQPLPQARGFAAIPYAARAELLRAGVVLLGPGGIVVNAAMLGAHPATYTPPTLDDLLASEDGPTLTVNATPRPDDFGMVEGCIAGLIAEGEARRGPYRYIG